MKARTTLYFLILVFMVTGINALERGPVAVSPGSESRMAVVGQSCPTFSWTGVEWANGYKVAVFEAVSTEVLGYEEMEAMASPVLSKEIQGRAFSWTPSSDERLSNGGVYVWYVQADDAYGRVMWSEGKVFKVYVEERIVGMGETVRESLKKHGVSDEVIDDVIRDMEFGVKEVVVWGVDTEGSGSTTQDKIGIQSLEGATNTFYGLEAGFSIASGGEYNSFFGRSAGHYSTTADYNTFVGFRAGCNNTTGSYNTFIGYYSGYANTIGNYNTFLGLHAGTNTTADANTFVGYDAGYNNTTGTSNTFIGYLSGESNTTGRENIFIGHQAGTLNTTGNYNTFMGFLAGHSNTTGYYNTFLGYYAGHDNTTGYSNTFLGRSAGYSNTDGWSNTFIGRNAGFSNTTGIANVFLGYYAGHAETGSNKLYIANTSTSSPLIWGDFGTNILTVHGKLGIGTKSPAYAMELETTGENAAFVAQRTDGATNYINATAGFGNFGTVTNHPMRLAVNSLWRMRLDSDNSLTMANGAMCTAGGTWQNYSKREAKENIHDLTTEEAMDTLEGLIPVKYNYKVDKEEKHVGFIAEDVPEMVASKDRNGISAMDVVAVLTKVVQEHQKRDREQQKLIDKLLERITELESRSQAEK